MAFPSPSPPPPSGASHKALLRSISDGHPTRHPPLTPAAGLSDTRPAVAAVAAAGVAAAPVSPTAAGGGSLRPLTNQPSKGRSGSSIGLLVDTLSTSRADLSISITGEGPLLLPAVSPTSLSHFPPPPFPSRGGNLGAAAGQQGGGPALPTLKRFPVKVGKGSRPGVQDRSSYPGELPSYRNSLLSQRREEAHNHAAASGRGRPLSRSSSSGSGSERQQLPPCPEEGSLSSRKKGALCGLV